jgi:hypothetical protein
MMGLSMGVRTIVQEQTLISIALEALHQLPLSVHVSKPIHSHLVLLVSVIQVTISLRIYVCQSVGMESSMDRRLVMMGD